MQTVKGLLAVFDTGTGAMCDRLAVPKGFGEFLCIIGVQGKECRVLDGLRVARVSSARNDSYFMPACDKTTRQMSANKTGSTGDCDFHK